LKKFPFVLVFTLFLLSVFAQQSTGLQFDERAYNRIPEIEKPLGFGENMPASFSLRSYTPKVENQGQFGTCVGWSTTYYAATIEYAFQQKLNSNEFITASAFDPYYTYLNITKQTNFFSCADGSLITDAGIFLKEKGLKRLRYNQLTCGTKIDASNKPGNVPAKVTGFSRVFNPKLSKQENISALKVALSEGHPVVIGMGLPQSFYAIGKNGLFEPKQDDAKFVADFGGHAMAVIGYDDERFGGTFEIVNSWGDEWADNGFCYVKYDDFVVFTRMGVVFELEVLPVVDEKACVYGDCENGYGRVVYTDGSIYEGGFVNSQRSGYGLFIWGDDFSFFGGEWEKSQRHGKGTLITEKGKTQSGYWKDDQFVSDQIVINTTIHGDLFSNLKENINFMTPVQVASLLKDKGMTDKMMSDLPKGCAYGDCNNGNGLFIAENYIYFGMYQSGVRHGYGEMRWTGEHWGNAYVGYSESNSREGIGAYYWPNGNVYIGEWKGGKRHGIGSFFKKDGDTQAGKFEDNNFISEGLGFGETEIDEPMIDPKNGLNVSDKSTSKEIIQSTTIKKKKKK
jgi:hypothetical protein